MYLCDIKLYSVFTLYVIKKGNVKFICKKGNKKNTYSEIFTKEKMLVQDEGQIESLSNYYSILEVMDYNTYKPLMLSKKQILSAYLWINEKELDKVNFKDQNIEIWQDYAESKSDTQDMFITSAKELIKK